MSVKVLLFALIAAPLVAAWQPPLAGVALPAVNRHASAPVMLFGRAAPPPVPEPRTLQSTIKSIGAAYCALSRPVKAATVLAAVAIVVLTIEFKKQKALVEDGEACMMGDDMKCESYDDAVEATPYWKLKQVAGSLVTTNRAAAKILDAPPDGFEWGLQQ